MSAFLTFLAILAVWALLVVAAGWWVGREARYADEQSEAERDAAIRRHPSSGRWVE